MNNPDNWTQDQFSTFVLIHAAQADLEICAAEREYISNRFGEENFKNMENTYFEMGEYERLNTILTCKPKHFRGESGKKKILQEMRNMFHIDGAFTKLEKNLLMFFEKLL